MTESATSNADIKAIVRDHWDNRAETFDDGPTHGIHDDRQREAWRRVLTELTGGQPLHVLDVGCGTGFLSLLLAEAGCTVTGIDIAPSMLERARAKAAEANLPVTFLEGDAESLPMTAPAFDLIVERHVIWTLPGPEAALREWMRVLHPGGRLALVEGDWSSGAAPKPDAQDDYAPIRDALPLYGGKPASVLAGVVSGSGAVDIGITPLMDEALWREAPSSERYLLVATRP